MSLHWLVISLLALLCGISAYTVDVNHPPRQQRNNDLEQQSVQLTGIFSSPADRIRNAIDWSRTQRRDARRPAAFISSHGYPVEEYKVTTPDGYILSLFRIPHGVKNSTNANERKEPVFIQHGLMSSAMDFLVTGPDRALGFIMADAGYDVWLGNTRGSTYSRAHRDLSPDAKQFWQFSWHEIGERDLPTMIRFVLRKTGYAKLHYIGHSQGTTSFFVMCHTHPIMQNKIQTMNALAPIAYMSNLYSPFVRFIAPFSGVLSSLYNFTTTGEVMARTELMTRAGYELCAKQSPFNQMCANLVYLAGGWGSDQLDPDQISEILSYSPATSSFFQLAHYGQGVVSGRFSNYNFGTTNNMNRYAKALPPKYDLARITARVALHYSDNDWLAAVVDVNQLSDELQNLVGKYRVPDGKFNHMDFCWGKDAKRFVYDRVIGVVRRFPLQSHDFRGISPELGGAAGGGFAENNRINYFNGNRDNNNNNNNSGSDSDEEEDTREEERTPGWGFNNNNNN